MVTAQDVASIDQIDKDVDGKQRGINALPLIVAQCNAIVSLVDETYFERAWCVVEAQMMQILRDSYGLHECWNHHVEGDQHGPPGLHPAPSFPLIEDNLVYALGSNRQKLKLSQPADEHTVKFLGPEILWAIQPSSTSDPSGPVSTPKIDGNSQGEENVLQILCRNFGSGDRVASSIPWRADVLRSATGMRQRSLNYLIRASLRSVGPDSVKAASEDKVDVPSTFQCARVCCKQRQHVISNIKCGSAITINVEVRQLSHDPGSDRLRAGTRLLSAFTPVSTDFELVASGTPPIRRYYRSSAGQVRRVEISINVGDAVYGAVENTKTVTVCVLFYVPRTFCWLVRRSLFSTCASEHDSTLCLLQICRAYSHCWLNTATRLSFAQSPPNGLCGEHQSTTTSTIRAVNSDDELDYNLPIQSTAVGQATTPTTHPLSLPTPTSAPATCSPHDLPPVSSTPESRSQRSERFSRVHEWERGVRVGQAKHISLRGYGTPTPAGMLAQSDGRSAGNDKNTRPRTKTLEERSRQNHSPISATLRSRTRVGSVHSPESISSYGAEYSASIPAHRSPPSVPSISTLEAQTQTLTQAETEGRRSISPVSPKTSSSIASPTSSASHRRVKHLMRTLNGGTSGSVLYRHTPTSSWIQSYCYTGESTAALMCESQSSEGVHRTLIPNLRCCTVRPRLEGETPYLEVISSRPHFQVQLKLLTQADFDAWYATLMFWASGGHPLPPMPAHPSSSNSNGDSNSAPTVETSPAVVRRQSSAHVETIQGQRERAMSNKSDRRKSVVSSHKEPPVIKIGKMIFWDTNTYTNSAPILASSGGTSTPRPTVHRLQSYGSRRWRRISGQLRENGELKLHSDVDNSLISVVELSQLSRCALQRLDSSVLDRDFCIGIYPQYMAVGTHTQPGFVRPIFLSLENRVLYEVWFVLLRAFTVPQLYGPSFSASGDDGNEQGNLAALPASTTHNMFRVERSLMVRVKEAKLYPTSSPVVPEAGFSGGHSKSGTGIVRPAPHGHYAEVLLDNETRGKTAIKYELSYPAWNESFEFLDLPSTLQSAGIVIKRRPQDGNQPVEHKGAYDAFTMNGDSHGGYTGLNADITCGKVDISELEEEKEVEKWWPLTNALGQQVGDIFIKIRADERVILMARDYQLLSDLLHRFSNNLTLHIAHVVHSDLKRLSDCLLSIFQVSGKVSDWLISLVEDEVDGLHKETPISRLRHNRRVGSEAGSDIMGIGGSPANREAIVRDMNKNATLEANLLFRGNTLLTKSLDTHMRRVGKEYLEQCLSAKLQDIRDKDLDCEVDPNKVSSQHDLERNWRRLNSATAEVWRAIFDHRQRCPIELRIIFKHIRACAEDTYGDFSRSVSYSSVSGFLFLRFFCPAVLNPKLFGLMKGKFQYRNPIVAY
nr:inhibitory regulator protein bud2/cla2 [Quercus suber]